MNIPEALPDLVDQIASGNCVGFVGAGLSQGAGLPNWTGLLHQMIEWAAEHGVDMSGRAELEGYIKEGKLLMVAEEMRERLVDDDFRRFMVETFRKPGLEPTEAHRLIPGIPFCAALTSNYDTLLERAYTLEWKEDPPVFTHSDHAGLSGSLRSNDFYIIKVHGTIDRIETVILGRKDYRVVMYSNPAYRRCLETIFSAKTVLFLGFSLTDPDLMMLLDELGAIFQGYTGKHYALVNTKDVGDIERRRFERDYNIHIIPYTPSAKDHPEVKAFLNELGEKCKQADRGKAVDEIPKPAIGKLSNVPEMPEHFLERPEYLNPIKELLLAGDSKTVGITGKTRRIGMHGMGGIGKSVLAAALARDEEVRRAFPDGVIWLTIGQTPSITSRQRQLALALADNPEPFEDEQQGKARLSEVLADKACLIVLDDVREVKHAAAFNVLGAECRLLITTRDAGIIRSLEAVERRLDVLSDEDALTLLAKSAGQPPAELPDEARQVAQRCGNLPLALAMIGSMAQGGEPGCWDNPLHRLKTGDLEKIKHEFPDYPYPKLLLAIQVSVDALDADIQTRYLDFAVFPEDTLISEAVLHTFWEPDGLDIYDCRDVLKCLVDRSLVRRDDLGYVSLHDLLLLYVRRQAGNLPALHNQLLSAYGEQCKDCWATGPNDGYFFQHLGYHLMEVERKEDLKELLLNFDWLQAKLGATDVAGLIADYDFLPDDEDLSLLQGAIRLSAHILTRDAMQLAGQLIGRLLSRKSSRIQAMLAQAGKYEAVPWLCPLTCSLTRPGGPAFRIQVGHTGPVWSVAVTPDDRFAISGSSDSTLKVWHLESGVEIRTLKGHTSSVRSVTVTPDGRFAVSASPDNTLKVWLLKSGEEIQTLKGHTSSVRSVTVTPNGRSVISASDDNTLKVWNLRTGREKQTLKGHTGSVNSVTVTPDGGFVISASSDRTLKVWNLRTGKEIRTLKGHAGLVNSVTVTPDGRFAVSASSDNTLKVWNLETGEETRTLKGHAGSVNSLTVTPDGRFAISASDDKTLRVWDLESGTGIRTLAGHTHSINSVTVTSDGRFAISASSDGTLKVWDLKIAVKMQTAEEHTSRVMSVTVTPDGRFAISASDDKTLRVWDLETGREIPPPEGHTWDVTSETVNLDDRFAISVSEDRTLKVQDLETGEKIRILVGHTWRVNSVAETPDGRLLISVSGETLEIQDLGSGEEIRTLGKHTSSIWYVAVTQDGGFAISASEDRTLKVWNLETGAIIASFSGDSPLLTCDVAPDKMTIVTSEESGAVHFLRLKEKGRFLTFDQSAQGESPEALG